jgi:hypothetical protein
LRPTFGGQEALAEWQFDYDPEGRRIRASRTGLERRFVVGPTVGTDLEVIHMITDQNDAPKCVYIYAGDQPLMRFEVEATGEPINPRVYLEDASGSVLGLADGQFDVNRANAALKRMKA